MNEPKHKNFFVAFLDTLSSRPVVAGIAVENGGLEYVLQGKPPKTFAVKFPDGVVKEGRIQKRNEFIDAAKKLHALADTDHKKKPLQVVVSLPAADVYTQAFSVPNIDREKLEESMSLNLQMLSPVAKNDAYMSAEVIGETPDKYDLLGAFIERRVVDEFRDALREAGFFAIAFEFPALSVTRLMKAAVTSEDHPTLVLRVSGDGVDFFIVKNGTLHFNYFRSWSSIQGAGTAIQRDLFISTIVTETQKVSNFVMSRFKERLAKTYVATPLFEAEIIDAIQTQNGVPAQPLTIPSAGLPPSWYVPLGAALRDFADPETDGINLNASSASDIFFEEHAMRFLYFWRRLAVLIGVFFLAAFLIAYSFLGDQLARLEEQLANSKTQANAKELAELKAKAAEFNGLVAQLSVEPRKIDEWAVLLSELDRIAKLSNVTIDRLSITSFGAPIAMTARAPENSATLAFKNALALRKGISSVEVPLLSIRELEDRSVGFSVFFSVDVAEFQAK
jgi:hypothetical protein